MLLFTLIYVDVIVIITNVIVTLLSTLNTFFLPLPPPSFTGLQDDCMATKTGPHLKNEYNSHVSKLGTVKLFSVSVQE